MKLKRGMLLDFFKLGHGLVVDINDFYESQLGLNSIPSDKQILLTNRYECEVLIQGTLYEMSIVIHFGLSLIHI